MGICLWLFPLVVHLLVATIGAQEATEKGIALREALVREAAQPGKKAWQPMLFYLAELHGQSVQAPIGHLPHPFESIGPGYQGGMAFGHIDLTHQRLDTVRAMPEHVRNQVLNELAGQQGDGLIPGVILFSSEGEAYWKDFKGFPPLWPVSVDAYLDTISDMEFLEECLDALQRQIDWFESERAVPGGGFYYLDVVQGPWESGMDEGIRYDERPGVPAAAVDACSHMYLVYEHAARWSRQLGRPRTVWEEKAQVLRDFIQEELWDPDSGFFYDSWTVRHPDRRHLAFEGMWPVVVGAASKSQAMRVIDEHLLNSNEFFAPHPISTVGLDDPKFELRMWRGPTWNCMTYWAARGCVRYGRYDAARRLLEAALDATAIQFGRTGTIWEFYHPRLGDPESLFRKSSGRRIPCRDYLGHNPLFAMVALWRKCEGNTGL